MTHRSSVTVLSGFSAPATEAVARTLMATAGHRLILLTDAELAAGTDSWAGLPDPFADFFTATDDREAMVAAKDES